MVDYDRRLDEGPKTAWSTSGPLDPNESGNPAITMQVTFPETGNYTIQFAINGEDESARSGLRKTIAYVTWSVEGNSVKRKLDVVNGTSISGTAQSVSVRVEDQSSSSAPNRLREYVASIQVTKGTRPATQQPPYLTTPIQTIGPDSDAGGVAVPQEAGAISVKVSVVASILGDVIPPEDIVVKMMGSASTLKQYNPLVDPGWVPLPSGCTFVRVESSAGAPVTSWYITFGIDG